MQTPSKLLTGLTLVSLFFACTSKKKQITDGKTQGDTIKIITSLSGDTVFKHFIRLDNKFCEKRIDTSIFSSKSIDTTIAQSNFFFTAQGFAIYFDRNKVIIYCDSVIKAAQQDKQKNVDWSMINGMERLKKVAQSENKMEEVLADWLSILFERFNPLVINTKTNKKLQLLLKEKYLSKYEGYRKYSGINELGDTSFIWYEQDYIQMEVPKK